MGDTVKLPELPSIIPYFISLSNAWSKHLVLLYIKLHCSTPICYLSPVVTDNKSLILLQLLPSHSG